MIYLTWNSFVPDTLTDEDTVVNKPDKIPVIMKLTVCWGRQNTCIVQEMDRNPTGRITWKGEQMGMTRSGQGRLLRKDAPGAEGRRGVTGYDGSWTGAGV